jgi:hypothetical protein
MPCIFCGSAGPLSVEHAYPRWIRRGVYATGPTKMWRGRDRRHIRTDTGLSVVLRKAVCSSCNTGWLASLEDRVDRLLTPALTGNPVVLTPESQRVVASWAVGRALVLELAMAPFSKVAYAPPSNLRWLYERRDNPIPPPGAHVWLAAVDARLGTEDALVAWVKRGWSADARREPERPWAYFMTFSAGCLVVQVAGHEIDTGDLDEPPRVMRPGDLINTVRLIWPARTDLVAWPPPDHLTIDAMTRFASWEGAVTATRRTVRLPDV